MTRPGHNSKHHRLHAKEAMPIPRMLDEVKVFLRDHSLRAGSDDAPRPLDEQPEYVRAATAFGEALEKALP